MLSKKFHPAYFIIAVLMISSIACSNGNSVVSPAVENTSGISQELPIASVEGNSNRSLLAVYDAVIDPVKQTFTITPSDRSAQYHYALTLLYPNVIQIVNIGWTPNFWADIKLKHPLPGTGITGYDPRVIAILPARAGVSCNYPVLDVHANNSVIMEPDGYTKLFDGLTSAPGNTNPFIAYFKGQPYRRWSGTGVTEETKRWQMNLSGFGGPIQFQLVVDVSTNYPNPPQPEIDNAPEPVQIEAIVDPGLTSEGGSADVTITLLDWQGRMSVGGVQMEAPDLFNSTVGIAYSSSGPYPNEYIYTGTITNALLSPKGEYKILVAAFDQTTGIYIYNESTAEVFDVVNNGNIMWAKKAGGSSVEIGNGITTLSDNSTVITGYFQGAMYGTIFGEGEPNETTLEGWYEDIFIAKYNPDGTLAWAQKAGGSGRDVGYGITTLSDNSIVLTGSFEGSATFGELIHTHLTSSGAKDIFIARYNPDGILAWAKRAGGTVDDYGFGITALTDNSSIVTGYFKGSATFGKDEPNEKVLWSSGGYDIFIARYNSDGTLAWAKCAGGTSDDYGNGITALTDNSSIVTGYFGSSDDTATFGEGEINETILNSAGFEDIFIARYNPDGALVWAESAGGSDHDYGYDITTLSDNSTVATGVFLDIATFGEGDINETVVSSAGSWDIFIACYNPNGTLAWAKRAGGTSGDYSYGITTLSDNSIVTTGCFGGSITFGPGQWNETILASAGIWDIFIACYDANGTFAWAKCAGGLSWDQGRGIASCLDNTTVVTGGFMDAATFGPGEPHPIVLTANDDYDIFVARFEP